MTRPLRMAAPSLTLDELLAQSPWFTPLDESVRRQVRAVARGLPVVMHGADEPALRQRFQAIIDRGQRDAGQLLLHAHEDIHRRGVIALPLQGVEHLPPLGGEAEPMLGNRLVAALAGVFHRSPPISAMPKLDQELF